MLNPSSIRAAISKANEVSYEFADRFIQDNTYGDEDKCCQLKILVIQRWSDILADYLRQHYDEDDNIIEPTFPCTTEAEISLVIGKIYAIQVN